MKWKSLLFLQLDTPIENQINGALSQIKVS